MKYRTFSAALTLLMLGSACTEPPARDDEPPMVGFVVANLRISSAKEMYAGFIAGVQHVGEVKYVVEGPSNVEGPDEIAIFQAMLGYADDGVSVFTLSPDLFVAPMAAAVAGGVPIIAVDSPPGPEAGVKLFVGNDNYELGRILARQIVAHLPSGTIGEIVLGSSAPGVDVLDRRAKGIRDEIKAKQPNVTVLGPFDTKQDEETNLGAWRTLVKVNPDALAFLGTGDADGWNLASIRQDTGGTWLAGAFDLDPKSLQAVKAGDLLLVSPEDFVKGAVAGRLQAEHARTGKSLPEGWLYIPGLVVDADNVKAVLARQATAAARTADLADEVETVLTDPAHLRRLSAAD